MRGTQRHLTFTLAIATSASWRTILVCAYVFAVLAALPSLAQSLEVAPEESKPAPGGYAARADVREFISEMARDHGFDARELRRLFAKVRYQPKVVAAMSRPVLAPPTWLEYAPRFLNPSRIDAGVAFLREHEAVLLRAQREFGVPAEIVVAIIGVETFYGRNTGSYRVIDALTTLAFDYPRRAAFFRDELKHFLLLCREQGVAALEVKGSYAGAMGLPQFMPGSLRNYAVDYDADGTIDLANDVDDAIGSVANFLARHDWQAGQPVIAPAVIELDVRDAVLGRIDGGMSERRSPDLWARDGVSGFDVPADVTADPVGLLMLEEDGGPSYWLVFNNWYVLTRYNRSRLYATVVWELAPAIKTAAAPSPIDEAVRH
jgi:membrane-bound lytic murein transglycosylase B